MARWLDSSAWSGQGADVGGNARESCLSLNWPVFRALCTYPCTNGIHRFVAEIADLYDHRPMDTADLLAAAG